MHVAARKDFEPIIDQLLKVGADPDYASRTGTPLNYAAASNSLRAAQRLIDAGASLNARNILDIGPMHSAARHGHREMIRLLLDSGADIEGEDPETPVLTELDKKFA